MYIQGLCVCMRSMCTYKVYVYVQSVYVYIHGLYVYTWPTYIYTHIIFEWLLKFCLFSFSLLCIIGINGIISLHKFEKILEKGELEMARLIFSFHFGIWKGGERRGESKRERPTSYPHTSFQRGGGQPQDCRGFSIAATTHYHRFSGWEQDPFIISVL